jgi:hypothetical protein
LTTGVAVVAAGYDTFQIALPCAKVLGPPGAFVLITYAHNAFGPVCCASNANVLFVKRP